LSLRAKILTRACFKKPAPCFSLFLLLFFLTACDPTKKLLPGEYIVDKVEVHHVDKTDLQKENMEAFFRQKPNRKLFRKVHFFVWWYNLFSEEKIQRKKLARNLKYDKKNAEKVKKFEKKNARRIKKGKKPKVPKLKDKESPIFLESLRDIGEPAVVFDSMLTETTRLQLSKYLFSKGYFDNVVTDSVKFLKNRRAYIKYVLYPGQPYTIEKITYDMDDEKLGALILADTVNTLLKRGMKYDAEKIQNERQRITDFALNNGYFYFENAYIDFNVDTAYNDHTTSMMVNLKKFGRTFSSSSDSVVYEDHPRFTIEHVYVITQPVYGNIRDVRFTDTLKSRSRPGMAFLLVDKKELAYRRSVLRNNIDIWPGHLFRKDTAEQTYKQLLGMGIFRNVTIQFLPNPDYNNRLDCYIMCSPLDKQSLTTQVEGTNTSGNLGIDGSVGYQNRNIFRGGELLEIKLQGAISAQKQLSKDTNYIKSITDVTDLRRLQRTFNTIQVGPELSFSAPRAYFPFSLLPFRKDQLPRTYIKTALNYQSRPEFSRVITNVDYGFSFRTSKNRLKHDFIPVEVYVVRAKLLSSFKNDLAKLNDAFLLNSFQDHITTLSKYGLTYTSKESSVSGKRAAFFAKLNVESSGSVLRTIYDVMGQPKDSLGRYLIIGIPFAQFLRSDIDFRVYIPVRTRSRVVYRIAGGIGKPLTNLNVLPYEQSFFSGGPNSVRAWRARTLGPGSYDPRDSETRFDKIGDILLEANFEYRFHIIKSFNGALFVDAGNIWRLEPDKSKPGGQFVVGSFIDEVAVGGGLGIRWDLNFFVLRLDLAAPLKDPKYAPGNRWTFDKKPWNQVVANFGIGYPF
jgi:outer membrane protein assembly factor BamA